MVRKSVMAVVLLSLGMLASVRPACAQDVPVIHASFSGTIKAEGATHYVSGMVYRFKGATHSSMGYQDHTGYKITARKLSSWEIGATYAKFTADIVINDRPRIFITEVWLNGGTENAISMSLWKADGITKKWGFDGTGILLTLNP